MLCEVSCFLAGYRLNMSVELLFAQESHVWRIFGRSTGPDVHQRSRHVLLVTLPWSVCFVSSRNALCDII